MSVQRIRLLFRSAAILLLLLSAALVAWAFQSPDTLDDPTNRLATARRSAARPGELISSPPLTDFAKVWRKELRRPLYDPPPAAQEPKRKDKKDPAKRRRRASSLADGGVQLLGTMLEDGRSLAVFMDSNGKIDLKGVGETLDLAPGTRVDRIELTQVTISTDGRSTTLQLPDTKAP